MIAGIYQIRNLVNGKLYVGSSNSVYRRWAEHRSALKTGKHGNPFLQSAWRKYGKDSFCFELLEQTSPAQLFERETYYVELLDPAYNLSKVDKHVLGHKQSVETRERIRRGKLGLKPTLEARQSMSDSAKARGISETMREAQRRSVTGRARPSEVRQRISESKRGVKATPEHRAAVSAGVTAWHLKRKNP